MPYPTRLLVDGEEVVLDLHPHWWFFIGPVAAGVPLVALLVASQVLLEGRATSLALYAAGALAVLWFLWLTGRLLRWKTTHFVVTSDRLIFRSGIVAKQGRDIPLERVNDISSSQSVFERVLGAGDLLIESAGERGQQVFTDIPHPDRVQQEIYRAIELNTQKTAGYSRAEATVPEQIAQLAGLRDKGIISGAEFEAKKADLLRRM